MTQNEARKTEGYREAVEKINNYRPGFQFTINYTNIPPAKARGLQMVLRDCCKAGLLESVSIGLNPFEFPDGPVEETYKRTHVKLQLSSYYGKFGGGRNE